jgi:hypothetical protein
MKVHGLSSLREHKPNTRSVFPPENLFVHQSAEPLPMRTERARQKTGDFRILPRCGQLLTFVSSLQEGDAATHSPAQPRGCRLLRRLGREGRSKTGRSQSALAQLEVLDCRRHRPRRKRRRCAGSAPSRSQSGCQPARATQPIARIVAGVRDGCKGGYAGLDFGKS